MRQHRRPLVRSCLVIALTALITACGAAPFPGFPALPAGIASTPVVLPTITPRYPVTDQPTLIRGTYRYTNDFVFDYYRQNAAALVDMTGFVLRDEEWELPVESQVLGVFLVDASAQSAQYEIALPAIPRGESHDFDPDDGDDLGVQIFATSWWPNLAGDPFARGLDETSGWPSYAASVRTDVERDDEVIGGRLVVWAVDDAQQFPSDFGADGLLFTADDPLQPLQPGYTVVDLDQQPFALVRDAVATIDLYEPSDVAIKDLSDESYSDAFRAMFEQLRREYAFNGIAGKEPDWDALWAELEPRVAAAERDGDSQAFGAALTEFVFAFNDGHVSIGGTNADDDDFYGGFGFAVQQADDGQFVVTHVIADGPAERAGVQRGAILEAIDGRPVVEVRDATPLRFGPVSLELSRRLEQARLMLRSAEGTQRRFRFSGAGPDDVTLRAEWEVDSYLATMRFPEETALPVEYELRDSGIGYIRFNSNYDDLYLLVTVFERALSIFSDEGVETVIFDLRANYGGQPLGMASLLIEELITIGQDEYFSDATGQFEPEGLPDVLEPADQTYAFDQMILLVDQACYSACEYEAYALSLVPGMVVMGHHPTAGTYGEVARGQFSMPADISLGFPTGRTVAPDGSVVLEGVGVVPTRRVPLDAATLLSDGDPVLEAAEAFALGE
jgi:C-terminal processing protease CtpA/Prc